MSLSGGICDGRQATGDEIGNGTVAVPASGTSVAMVHMAQHFMQA